MNLPERGRFQPWRKRGEEEGKERVNSARRALVVDKTLTMKKATVGPTRLIACQPTTLR